MVNERNAGERGLMSEFRHSTYGFVEKKKFQGQNFDAIKRDFEKVKRTWFAQMIMEMDMSGKLYTLR